MLMGLTSGCDNRSFNLVDLTDYSVAKIIPSKSLVRLVIVTRFAFFLCTHKEIQVKKFAARKL